MPRNRAPSTVWSNPLHFLAFGFGSGASPHAPGTAGTLVAVPVYLLLGNLPPLYYGMVTLVLVIFGIWLCGRVSAALAVDDHPGIVWDEITGYLVTMFMVPRGWSWLLAGFVLFRLFDIWKPFPIGWLDRQLRGGTGIMADDLLAGAYACGLLHLAAVYT